MEITIIDWIMVGTGYSLAGAAYVLLHFLVLPNGYIYKAGVDEKIMAALLWPIVLSITLFAALVKLVIGSFGEAFNW